MKKTRLSINAVGLHAANFALCHEASSEIITVVTKSVHSDVNQDQWRHQDLLRGRAQLKLGHGALTTNRAGCSSGLMTDSFVTNVVLIERAVSC